MLILFDVDATLITTSRLGIAAMGFAGRERYGEKFDENTVDYAGRLDPLIIGDLLRAHAQQVTPEAIELFRAGYRTHLGRLLGENNTAKTCPGVPELLEALFATPSLCVGLLTGNYPDTGRIKLTAAGIDADRFHLHVWGCDSPHDPPARDHLPGVALERYRALHAIDADPGRVWVVGDTPHDIACARAHGCRSLGVATGMFSMDELRRAGADEVAPDLRETRDIVRILTGQAAPVR